MAQNTPSRGNFNRGNQSSGRAVASRNPPSRQEPAVKGRAGKKSILDHMAARFHMDPMDMQRTLMSTVFAGASNEEFAALLLVAEAYKLNPITKELYAFPKKGGGIMPMVSIDGWIRIINEHPQMAGIEWEDIPDDDGNLVAIECTIWRKDRPERPVKVIEYLKECKQNTDPWNKMPARMLRHKATIQCGRYAFGFSGIYDEGDVLTQADGFGGEAEAVPPMRRIPEDPPMRDITPERREREPVNRDEAPAATNIATDTDGSLYDTESGEVRGEDEPTPPTHPAWKRAGEIVDDLSDVTTIIDLGTFRARTLGDIEAMPSDVQDVINGKLDECEAKLKGGK